MSSETVASLLISDNGKIDIDDLLLAIQQNPDLQAKYGPAYISLKEHSKQLANETSAKDRMVT